MGHSHARRPHATASGMAVTFFLFQQRCSKELVASTNAYMDDEKSSLNIA